MNETQINRKLATLICIVFATNLVSIIYGMAAGSVLNSIGPKVFNIGVMLLDLPIIICAFLIASRNDLDLTGGAKAASWAFGGIQTLGFLNILCYIIFDNNVTGVVGPWANILFSLLFACSAICFYASLHIWTPVKIAGIVSALPQIVSGLLLYKIAGMGYSEELMPLFTAMGITVFVSAVFYSVALILSIVWLLKKPSAPSIYNLSDDII